MTLHSSPRRNGSCWRCCVPAAARWWPPCAPSRRKSSRASVMRAGGPGMRSLPTWPRSSGPIPVSSISRNRPLGQFGQCGIRDYAFLTASPSGGIDAYNDRQVAKRADTSLADLLDEFARNRAATIAAVEATEEALLAAPIRSAGGVEGPLGAVIRWVAVDHVQDHVRDIPAET